MLSALLILLVTTTAGIAASTVGATTAESDDHSVGATTTTSDELTVAVETPGTIVSNGTQNYTVRVDGAEGNVSTTWSFEGETKTGETVQHAFSEAGNATIEVTVTDESGATVTRTLQVRVVEFGDEDDAGNPLDNLGTMVAVIVAFIGMKAVLFLYVFPKGMLVFTDAL